MPHHAGPGRRAWRVAVVLVALLPGAGCSHSRGSDAGAGTAAGLHIALTHDAQGAVVEVRGLSAADLTSLRRRQFTFEEWSTLLGVSVAEPASSLSRSPMLGTYSAEGAVLSFRPMYRLDPGRPYLVRFDPGRLPSSARSGEGSAPRPIVEATIREERAEARASTAVVSVYPSGDVLPENTLRIYVQFSRAMGSAGGVGHIHLLDDSGHEIDDAFVPMETRLWSADRTLYTVLFDPGRVKRGILPNEQLGRPLRRGRTYTLAIDLDWLDADGAPLVQAFRRTFRVGPALTAAIDPTTWRLQPAATGTRDPLVVLFPMPLDYALLQRTLAVVGLQGDRLAGNVAVDSGERRWSFTPTDAWRDGEYRLLATATLEDAAGNRIGRAFEQPMSSPSPTDDGQMAVLPFHPAAGAH